MQLLYEFIKEDLRPFIQEAHTYVREKREHIRRESLPKSDDQGRLFDAKYAEARIGVGDKTISRLSRKGELPVICYVNRKRQFRESDIERCRRLYGRG